MRESAGRCVAAERAGANDASSPVDFDRPLSYSSQKSLSSEHARRRRVCGLAFDRRSIARYGLPVVSLGLAALLHLHLISIEGRPVPGMIVFLAIIIVLIFATVFVVLHHAEMIAERARRALRHAAADLRGHGDRGVDHRVNDAARAEQPDAGARIRVFHRHDRLRGRRRRLPHRWRVAASLPGHQTARNKRLSGRPDGVDRADADPAQLHADRRCRHILVGATGLRQHAVGAALRGLRVQSDGASPRGFRRRDRNRSRGCGGFRRPAAGCSPMSRCCSWAWPASCC